MTVLQTLRDGPLCGIFPRRLEVRLPSGRTAQTTSWRGQRTVAIAFARTALNYPGPFAVSLVYVAFAWDETGKRRRVERTMEFSQPLRDLLAEEQQREQGRDQARRRSVQWRPGPRRREPKPNPRSHSGARA